jgi:replicative DNA helicase
VTAVSPTIALVEPEVEAAVLGSLIVFPASLPAGELDLDWFGDPGARLLAEAIRKIYQDGHNVSAAALAAGLPDTLDGGGTTRASFIAGVMSAAVATEQLPACIDTLRDRWARRQLAAQVDVLSVAASDLNSSPFDTAALLVSAADRIGMSRGENATRSLGAGVDELLTSYSKPRQQSATTGIPALDRIVSGYHPGRLFVLAGRPGMGKSAFAASSLRKTAKAGHGVAFFSLEMSVDEISARALADEMGDINGPFFGNLLRGDYDQRWYEAVGDARDRIRQLPFIIDASPNLTFAQIAARARRRKTALEAKGLRLDVVAIDHMGLITPSDRYSGNKVAEAGEISRAAKGLAKELGCCVMLLSQLSRNVEVATISAPASPICAGRATSSRTPMSSPSSIARPTILPRSRT